MRKKLLALIMLLCGICCLGVTTHPVMAGNNWDKEICTKIDPKLKDDYGCNEDNPDATGVAVGIINAVTMVVGIIAVLMIVIGGVNYATSSGDPSKVKKAKDTILYSAIGLVVALLAFSLVNFVLAGVFE